ncbi:hypothetical protein AB0M39_38075 [Streptomyces sp. NPDC051907]|uniref:hypothetical protein n=1 Tax=Streptomyces sp. NPDC051907 TaxID=3155284 RepID=UPI00343EDB06
MATNPAALKLVRAVAGTPGFQMEGLDDGSFKLIRNAIPEHDLDVATVKISPRAHNRQYENAVARLRHIGWTQELYDKCSELTRAHRIADTDPYEDHLKALLDVLGVDPDADAEDTGEVPAQRTVKRHSKNVTTGRSKVKAMPAPVNPGSEAEAIPIADAPPSVAEIITPERALDLLVKLAPYQRPLREKKVEKYAAAMKRGEWKLNPADPICIDTNDQTANGQHRLHAVVESETPQPFYVAYGVDPDAYRVMDRGAGRTAADMLHGAGEVSTKTLSAVAKLGYLWFNVEQSEWRSTPEVTDAQIFALLESHPNLRESVRLGGIGGGMKVSPTASRLAHYIISRKMGGDTRTATAWYRAIATMDLDRGQPGHSLGLYWLKSTPAAQRRTTLKGRTKMELDLYLLIQGWNNSCQGKEQRGVSWKSDFVIAHPITPGPNAAFPPLD